MKRDYFPYFTRGRDITINENGIQLYAIQDDQVQPPITLTGLDLPGYSAALNNEGNGSFELTLAPAALVRDRQANVSVIINTLFQYNEGRS